MKSKIAHYKSTYKGSSLLFKAKVHPPNTYFQGVHKMICEFLWEGKRHWVKPLFIYLPVENGGLGIKNNSVQYLIFKQRAVLKGLMVNDTSYFLRNVRNLAFEFFFSNKMTDGNFGRILVALNVLKFKFKKIPQNDFKDFNLTNQLYFTDISFPFLLSIGCKSIGNALAFETAHSPSLRANQVRKLRSEKEALNLRLSQFGSLIGVNSKGYEFEAFDTISDARIDFNRHNDYRILLISKFEISKI